MKSPFKSMTIKSEWIGTALQAILTALIASGTIPPQFTELAWWILAMITGGKVATTTAGRIRAGGIDTQNIISKVPMFFIIAIMSIGLTGCDWTVKDETNAGPDNGNCMLLPSLTYVEDCVYDMQIAVSGCTENPIDMIKFLWQYDEWKIFRLNQKETITFDRGGTLQLILEGYSNGVMVYNDSNEANYYKIKCNGSEDPGSGDLEISVGHKWTGNCDDVVISWNDTGATWYELFGDGDRIAHIVNDDDFAYGVDQIEPYVMYSMIDSFGSSDSEGFDRQCPGDM